MNQMTVTELIAALGSASSFILKALQPAWELSS